MSNHGMWLKSALVGLVCVAAQATHTPGHEGKGITMGGSFEGGYNYFWTSGVNDSQFLVDHAALSMTGNVSDKTTVVINNAFALRPGNALNAANTASTANYFSNATLTNGGFVYSNLGAYISHKCAEGWVTSVGHMRNPFGMEGMWSRYEMPTYYYSSAYTSAQGLGWNYDLGVKFTLTDMIPGSLELTVADGHAANPAGENKSPALVGRYSYAMKGGDWTFTPVVSAYYSRFSGGPDLGITAGGMLKMGTLWVNAEWVMVNRTVNAVKTKNSSIYVEPGMELGFADVSVKAEYNMNDVNATGSNTNDINVGVALSKTYNEKYRIRATYQHTNLSAKVGAHNNDFRLLFGTTW